ncbi:TonB-dependent receptor [Gaoshiqia sediminis]|uniref:TonB-dependent receptor n=1 Tax=Gaoshiqia sediminis TaxID=2986998 RepID=A0AA41YDR5_9BACT|nr:TonB-dependent receptor [Gaoshiqia sediminis]MCW0484885.1 TonB-dependent receptor [Gaoshiqia sediminis]
MKKNHKYGAWYDHAFKKTFLIMRLVLVISLVCIMQTFALDSYTQNSKISLSVRDLKLEDIIMQIESGTKYRFAYNRNEIDVDKNYSVSIKEAEIKEVLDQLFSDQGINYVIIDRQIILSAEEDPFISKQNHTVSGRVIDSMGMPMPGVTVVIKGSTKGTITDLDGKYSLADVSVNATLQFSFVGMRMQEIQAADESIINVTMVEETVGIEEVVAVGYGTQRKETLTGSISKVDGDELARSQTINLSSSLAGKLPGLIVNQRTGTPGAESLDITIRGTGTFNNNSPLVVVDGVPRDNILERINPEDIESVTILKDASAAIYGARAANGVILVTTKEGAQSKPTFNLSYSYGINNPTKVPDMMDAVLFAQVFNETQYYLQGRPDMSNYAPFFSDEAIQKFRDGSDPILYPNTNWPEVSLKKNPSQQRINFQASGGSENIRYLLSFGTSDQGGNYVNQPYSYKKYNARARVDVDLTKNLTVGANMSAILEERSEANGTDFVTILQANPTLVAVYPNGLIAPGRFGNNPLLSNRRGYNKWKNDPINTTFTASYKVPFVEGLTLDASYNYDLRNQFQKVFSKPHEYHEYNVQTGEYDPKTNNIPISVEDTYSRWTTALSNFRISYKTTIKEDHNVSAMVGTEQQKQTYSYAMAYRKNFVSPAIPQINAGSTKPEDLNNGGSASENAYNNFFGRVNYNFKSKYLLEFVFRYDGSQIFPEGKRYGFFPAVSGGWRISEEDFMANMKFIDELKLRGSYGELGNDRVPAYQYLQAFQFGNNFVFGGGDVPGIYSSTLPNPNITWEVSKKLDFGMDAILWNRLLGVEVTVFNEKRSNILLQRNLSIGQVFGFPALPDQNIGEVENHGFEVVLTHQNTIGDLTYSVNGNVSFARSKIIFMDETPPTESYQTNTGHPLGSDLYYKSDGIFNTQEELDSYPHGAGSQVGDIKVLDLNGDKIINGDDRYRASNSPQPEYVFGLTANLQYKGFDLSLFFQGQTNAWTYDGTVDEFGQEDLDNGLVYRATNRWTISNQEGATMPRSNDWQPGTTDFFLYDATFFRLKNAELGYTLPASILSKTGINDVRVFVNGVNLLTWAKEITWRDPEMSGGFTQYPPLRILSFGVNVKF